MLIKLTYYGTNRPTLVNFDNVESIYEVFDKIQRRMSTKICFRGNDSYVNVDEDLKSVMKIYQECVGGKQQEIDWETQSVDNTMTQSFSEQSSYRMRPRRNYNNNSYNRNDIYNENLY